MCLAKLLFWKHVIMEWGCALTGVGFKVGGDTSIKTLVLQVHYKDVTVFLPPSEYIPTRITTHKYKCTHMYIETKGRALLPAYSWDPLVVFVFFLRFNFQRSISETCREWHHCSCLCGNILILWFCFIPELEQDHSGLKIKNTEEPWVHPFTAGHLVNFTKHRGPYV